MTGAAPKPPGVGVPPPAIYLAGFGLGAALEALLPTPGPPPAVAAVVGVLGAAVWAALDPGAMREFGRARTPVSPSRPARVLVVTGPYRWSRNPMYVGMAVLHAALAIALGVLWALLTLVGVLVVVDRAIVAREERHLAATFGDAYDRYRGRVRRWL
jgi:protein-S-isoprenylcysteine O-methyltransferase Ste14